jgi:hypothetical protein
VSCIRLSAVSRSDPVIDQLSTAPELKAHPASRWRETVARRAVYHCIRRILLVRVDPVSEDT